MELQGSKTAAAEITWNNILAVRASEFPSVSLTKGYLVRTWHVMSDPASKSEHLLVLCKQGWAHRCLHGLLCAKCFLALRLHMEVSTWRDRFGTWTGLAPGPQRGDILCPLWVHFLEGRGHVPRWAGNEGVQRLSSWAEKCSVQAHPVCKRHSRPGWEGPSQPDLLGYNPMAGGCNWMGFKVPPSPRHSMILWSQTLWPRALVLNERRKTDLRCNVCLLGSKEGRINKKIFCVNFCPALGAFAALCSEIYLLLSPPGTSPSGLIVPV